MDRCVHVRVLGWCQVCVCIGHRMSSIRSISIVPWMDGRAQLSPHTSLHSSASHTHTLVHQCACAMGAVDAGASMLRALCLSRVT